ncbi:MAG: STAS domain-containing protein [Myxococcota bacterium]
MQFERSTDGDVETLAVRGELDSLTAPELRPILEAIAETDPQHVILDLAGLRLIDSSGVGAIVWLFKRVKATGGAFEVRGVQGQPRSIFKVLSLDRVFAIE